MKWLVACERSGIVRDALRALGQEAWSCDLFPSRRPSAYHLQCPVQHVLHYPWDGLIAHPVCRIMANSGVRWLYIDGRKENGPDPQRWRELEAAVAFYKLFCDAVHIPKRAVENPIMHEYAAALVGHRADQFIHPWWFGSPFQKATGFKLYGLPKLPQERRKDSYAQGEIKQNAWRMPPGPDREEKRSETDPQVARAIAQYWG